MAQGEKAGAPKLAKYLTPLGAWALAFGCSVGWGAFVMPGSTFLPVAGPVGTAIGIAISVPIMLVVAINYHYLINRYPDAGGTYAFTKACFDYDHGFVNAWFLILCYVAIIWANATALPLIARNLFGSLFQVGFHYQIAGFDIYFGEVLMAILSLLLAGFLCLHRRVAGWVQIVMALVLLVGAGVCAYLVVTRAGATEALVPPFAPDRPEVPGVITIIALAPWAFVGFESICHSSAEFEFSPKRSFRIMAIAVVTAAVAYGALAVLATTARPEGVASWPEYIAGLGSYEGIQNLPTFFAASVHLGNAGYFVLGFMALAGIITGLVGNYIASSRLLYAMAEDEMLPPWFAKIDKGHVPSNAIIFLMAISIILPFFGRTAISWIVDVTTVGATIAYAYASACAYKTARTEGNMLYKAMGAAGFIISLIFAFCFLAPNLMAVTTLSTESYLILAAWGILGFAFFLYVFRKDDKHRFGRSTITWAVLLALIIFTSTVWVRQESRAAAHQASEVVRVMEEDEITSQEVGEIEAMLEEVGATASRSSLIQTWLIVVALAILFYIYSLMQRRGKQLEVEKVLAEESSRAKTSFLSNMSHEIRTPMNAIIGLDNIALKDPDLSPHTREQLEKIGASARHLLALINDILDMSRIESGRMVLKNEEFSFRDFLDQINVIVNGQCDDKGLTYECRIVGHVDDYYVGDDMKLRQVLINILGNAVKFTNVPGSVTLTVEQVAQFEGHRTLRFVMADTGIGMSKDYIPKIFDAFSQEEGASTTANKYGSTGLGMAITKNIVEMMNGEIEVESERGVGSVFTVTVTLKASSRSVNQEEGGSLPEGLRLLVVDDDEVACEHAQMVANDIGITADYMTAADEALVRLRVMREKNLPYHLVLTDYKMPGMNGIEFTQSLHAFDQGETAVIVMTGYSWDDLQDEAREAGVDAIMSKPLFTDSLLRQVKEALARHAGEGAEEMSDSGADVDVVDNQGGLEGLHVLVAEDFEINAEILIDLLDLEGITAEHAENGQIAVDLFAASEQGHFDAVLMDVRMPVMDGLAAARAIRELDRDDAKEVPIIALTANAFDEDVQRSLQAGMSAHLSKPVEPERLFETLEQLVHGSSGA